jgi:hypothetical protein
VAIRNGQSRETGNIDEENKTKTQYNVEHHYTKTNRNNINKTQHLTLFNNIVDGYYKF